MDYKSMLKFRINIAYILIYLKRLLPILNFIQIFTANYYGEAI
jgi:hypothetical protein